MVAFKQASFVHDRNFSETNNSSVDCVKDLDNVSKNSFFHKIFC